MSGREKLGNMISNHKNSLLAVALNGFFLVLLFCFNGFQYELSDDWFFSMNIAEGHCDFTFCSYFIQWISEILQRIIYPVNAFMLLQLVLGFLSLTTICYVFFDTFGIKKGILPVLFLEGAFAFNAYSLITFSKTAGVLVVAGGLVIFWAHCKNKKSAYAIYGMVLALLGSFYRLQIFYSVFVIFAFFLLGYLLHQAKPFGVKGIWNECKKFFQCRMVLVLGILLVAIFSCNSLSRTILYANGTLDEYREYNSLRSSVVDFQLPDLAEEPEKYQEIGISQNDIEMLRNWYLDHQGHATVDNLRVISKLQEGRQTEKAYLINMVMSFAGMAELLLLVVYLVTVLGIILIYQRKSWWFILSNAIGVGLLYGYLFLIGRSNYRSVFSIWFATVVCMIYATQFMEIRSWVSGRKRGIRQGVSCLCVVLSVVFFAFGILKAGPSITRKAEKEFPGLEKYIEASEGKIFALGRTPYLLFRNMTQFDNALMFEDSAAFEKCVYFGTPYYGHPSYQRLLQKAGIDNLYTALTEKDNLYFVDHWYFTDIEKMVCYMNEQYGQKKKYDSRLIHEVEEFKIYQIYATE